MAAVARPERLAFIEQITAPRARLGRTVYYRDEQAAYTRGRPSRCIRVVLGLEWFAEQPSSEDAASDDKRFAVAGAIFRVKGLLEHRRYGWPISPGDASPSASHSPSRPAAV